MPYSHGPFSWYRAKSYCSSGNRFYLVSLEWMELDIRIELIISWLQIRRFASKAYPASWWRIRDSNSSEFLGASEVTTPSSPIPHGIIGALWENWTPVIDVTSRRNNHYTNKAFGKPCRSRTHSSRLWRPDRSTSVRNIYILVAVMGVEPIPQSVWNSWLNRLSSPQWSER